MKRKLGYVFAVLILVVLFHLVGAEEMLKVFFNLQWDYVLYLLVLGVVGIWLSSLKWQLFIRAGGNDVPIGRLMKLYTVSYFFNTFAPSTIGGDIARSYHLGRHVDNQRDAFVATFLERFTGIFAMALLGVGFTLGGAKATAGLTAAVLTVGTLIFLATGICFFEPLRVFCFSLARQIFSFAGNNPSVKKLLGLLDKVDEGMRVAKRDMSVFVKSLLLSLAFHAFTVVNTYVAARAVGWESVDFFGLFIVVPLVLLVSMAPVTPSGLGIQEGAFLFFLQRIGGTLSQGLGVGLVLRAKVMLAAISGALIWLQIRNEPKGGEAQVSSSVTA